MLGELGLDNRNYVHHTPYWEEGENGHKQREIGHEDSAQDSIADPIDDPNKKKTDCPKTVEEVVVETGRR